MRWIVDDQHFRKSTPDSTAFVRELFATHGAAVGDLEVRRASLEDTYLALVRGQEAASMNGRKLWRCRPVGAGD